MFGVYSFSARSLQCTLKVLFPGIPAVLFTLNCLLIFRMWIKTNNSWNKFSLRICECLHLKRIHSRWVSFFSEYGVCVTNKFLLYIRGRLHCKGIIPKKQLKSWTNFFALNIPQINLKMQYKLFFVFAIVCTAFIEVKNRINKHWVNQSI